MEATLVVRQSTFAGPLGPIGGATSGADEDLRITRGATAYIPLQVASASSTRPDLRASFASVFQWRPAADGALMSKAEIGDRIAQYERQFDMSSEKFLETWHDGTAPDSFETMYWRILLKYR